MKIQPKHKIISDLHLYFCGSESISGLCSNFTSCVQVIDNSNYANEHAWTTKVHHTLANDGVFHDAMAAKIDNITKIKSARRVLKLCDSDLHNRLALIFYESPGKISGWTREYMQYYYNKIYIDVSALSMYVGKLTILELEQLARDTNKKVKFKELIKRTKELCDKTLNEYIYIHQNHIEEF